MYYGSPWVKPVGRPDAACSVAIDGEATCSLRSELPTRKRFQKQQVMPRNRLSQPQNSLWIHRPLVIRRTSCVGIEFILCCFHSKRFCGMGLQARASVCASEKGKPIVRRGRKAQGPPRARWEEVAGLPNGDGDGATGLRPQRGRGCADATLHQTQPY